MVKVRFIGHAAFLITHNNHRIIIDPFITGNPKAALRMEDINVQYVLVTHGHGDHLGDAIPIAKRNDATIIAPFELAMYCQRQGAKVHPMHIGGSFKFDFGRVKLTPALHGSAVVGESIEYTGNPCGFLLEIGGKRIYHPGDTGLFGDMELMGRTVKIDLAMLPIGDNFTMGVDDAAEATRMLKPSVVIPMHYDTFDIIKADPQKFAEKISGTNTRCVILRPGEEFEL